MTAKRLIILSMLASAASGVLNTSNTYIMDKTLGKEGTQPRGLQACIE